MSRQTSRPNCFAAGLRSWLAVCAIITAPLLLTGCSERRSVAPPLSPSDTAAEVPTDTIGEPMPSDTEKTE